MSDLPGIEVLRLPVKKPGPKGLAPYTPRAGSKNSRILSAAQEVVAFYEAQDRLPLGSREIGYVMTGDAYGYAKDDIPLIEQAVERARRAGKIDEAAVSDGRTSVARPWEVDDAEEIVEGTLRVMGTAQLDRQAQQGYRVEVWAEASSWLARLESMCNFRGVSVYSGSGSVPWGAVRRAAGRVIMSMRKQTTVILQIGDLDLHGLRNIARPFEADLTQTVIDLVLSSFRDDEEFVHERMAEGLQVRRLLLTPEQVEQHVGQRARDRRLTAEDRKAGWPYPWKVQAEALAPEIRDQIVTDALDELLDADLRDDVIAAEEPLHQEARALLRRRLRSS